jgi:hypothetical protein
MKGWVETVFSIALHGLELWALKPRTIPKIFLPAKLTLIME